MNTTTSILIEYSCCQLNLGLNVRGLSQSMDDRPLEADGL